MQVTVMTLQGSAYVKRSITIVEPELEVGQVLQGYVYSLLFPSYRNGWFRAVWNAEVRHVVVDAFKDYSDSHIYSSGIICTMGKLCSI